MLDKHRIQKRRQINTRTPTNSWMHTSAKIIHTLTYICYVYTRESKLKHTVARTHSLTLINVLFALFRAVTHIRFNIIITRASGVRRDVTSLSKMAANFCFYTKGVALISWVWMMDIEIMCWLHSCLLFVI